MGGGASESSLASNTSDPLSLPALSSAVVSRGEKSVSEWLIEYYISAHYKNLTNEIGKRFRDKRSFTAFDEMALIYSLIQYIKPAHCLEIGTLFADTSRVMAEAIANANLPTALTTIDPFGAHRVPNIISAWPSKLQTVVEFEPVSSMTYFLSLEDKRVLTGNSSPLGLVFVDGHHALEYALFDILSAANWLRPGGVIVVDNLEQDGPRSAVLTFLQWNPAWKLFFDGKILRTPVKEDMLPTSSTGLWAVLISPREIQIANFPVKFTRYNLNKVPIKGLEWHFSYVSTPGQLVFNLLYLGVPADFHNTGNGLRDGRVTGSAVVTQPGKIVVCFDPLDLDISPGEFTASCELEARFQGLKREPNSFCLLTPEEPFSLIFTA